MHPYKYHLSSEDASRRASRTPTSSPAAGPRPLFPSKPGRRAEYARLFAATIVARSEWLPADERSLLRALYEHGQRISEVAAVWGRPPSSLRSKVRSILRRMRSEEFAFVALHLQEFSPTMRAVADACILRGMSIVAAAAELKLTQHQVRRHRDLVLTLFQESLAAARRGARAS